MIYAAALQKKGTSLFMGVVIGSYRLFFYRYISATLAYSKRSISLYIYFFMCQCSRCLCECIPIVNRSSQSHFICVVICGADMYICATGMEIGECDCPFNLTE